MFTINSSIPSKILETPEDDKVLTVELHVSVDNSVNLCLLYNPPSSGTEYQEKLTLLSYIFNKALTKSDPPACSHHQ